VFKSRTQVALLEAQDQASRFKDEAEATRKRCGTRFSREKLKSNSHTRTHAWRHARANTFHSTPLF
jgi:hypothetical protein